MRSRESNRVVHITFVCTGNTCRSPMAEAIARAFVLAKGMTGVTVSSAGTAAWPGAPASAGARIAAAESGLDLESHSSMPLTGEVLASSDLVLCMDGFHLSQARTLTAGEGGEDRCHLLSELAGSSGEVRDPFGAPDEVYRATFDELSELVWAVLARIASADEAGQ